MPNAVSYPLDLSGVSPNNLVEIEVHSVNEAQFRDYFFIVPQLAPFYVDNFQLSLVSGNTTTILTEDVQYSFALPYVTGTRHTGKQMYGAVTLNNLDMNGILKVTYQTVGGDQVADRLVVLSLLADKAYNPRTTIWDVLTNAPAAFPPVPHYQDYDNFVGQEALVLKLAQIRDAILANSTLTSTKIQEFLDEFNRGESAQYIKKAGDTMAGPLRLLGTPSDPQDATSKAYVDSALLAQTAQLQTFNQQFSTIATVSYVNSKFDELMAYFTNVSRR